MAVNASTLFSSLETATDKLYEVIDELSTLSTSAIEIGGVIGQTLPTQINNVIDKVQGIISDTAGDSLTSMKTFLGNVPLNQTVPQSAKERAVQSAPMPPMPSMAPQMQNSSPQSAIAASNEAQFQNDAEEQELKEWYSDRYGKKQKMQEANSNPYSWDAIRHQSDITGYDIGEVGDDNVLYDDPNIDIELPDDSEFEEEYENGLDDSSKFGTEEYIDKDWPVNNTDDAFEREDFEPESIEGRRIAESSSKPLSWQAIAAHSGINFDLKSTCGPAVSGVRAMRDYSN